MPKAEKEAIGAACVVGGVRGEAKSIVVTIGGVVFRGSPGAVGHGLEVLNRRNADRGAIPVIRTAAGYLGEGSPSEDDVRMKGPHRRLLAAHAMVAATRAGAALTHNRAKRGIIALARNVCARGAISTGEWTEALHLRVVAAIRRQVTARRRGPCVHAYCIDDGRPA